MLMRKYLISYGLLIGLVIVSTFWLNRPDNGALNLDNAEWIGYTTMIVALSSIFFAVRQYRDQKLGGQIKFLPAFLLGLYITLVAGLVYVVGWEIYYGQYGGEFVEIYAEQQQAQMTAEGKTPAEIQAALAENAEMMETYNNNTLFRMGITYMEILPVGLVVSLLVGLIYGVLLKPKPELAPDEVRQ